MKTSLLTLTLFLALANLASAFPVTTITGASFTDSVAIMPGSQQYVDVLYTGGSWTSSDSLKIYIQHITNGNGGLPSSIYAIAFGTGYMALPTNPDSSRRIYFDMPAPYTPDSFQLSINLQPSHANGILQAITTDIPEDAVNAPAPVAGASDEAIQQTNYYSLTGAHVTLSEVEGWGVTIYNKETIYTNGQVTRRKECRLN